MTEIPLLPNEATFGSIKVVYLDKVFFIDQGTCDEEEARQLGLWLRDKVVTADEIRLHNAEKKAARDADPYDTRRGREGNGD